MVPVRFSKFLSRSTGRSRRARKKCLVHLIVFALVASSLSGLTLITASSPAHAIAATAVAEVYMDAPFVQGSYAQEYGGVTENFDEIASASNCTSLPSSTTLTNGETMTVVSGTAGTCNDGTYAAYSTTETATVGGSHGNMLRVYANGQVSIKFPSPQRYIGFWWSGGDDQNSVQFYSHGIQIATLSTATLKSIVGLTAPLFSDTGVVTSTGGSSYYKKYYWNNPGLYSSTTPSSYPSGGSPEPFVYVHAFAQNAQTMDEIRLTQGSGGGAFEVDNITGSTQNVPIRNSLAFVNEVTSTNLKWTIKTATNSIYSDYNGSCTSNCAFSQQVYSDTTGNWVVLKYTNTSVVSDTSTVSLVDGIGTFTVPALVSSFTYLIVGGGGGGGYDAGGGGGGGGIETGTITGLSQGDTFTITVGSGGLGGGACHNVLQVGSNSTNSGNGNCDSSSVPNGKAYYYSNACSYTDTSGTNHNDANLGQNGMNGDTSTLVGAHSTSLSAYGGGGGGGRCQPGNSSGNIANSGGAGEKCFASRGYNTSDIKTSTSCTNTSPGTQANATYYIGGGASYFTGGGGGGYGSKGGTFGQDSFCGTYPNVYTCTTGSRSDVYSILSSEGGAGSTLFSGSPLAGTYGGGGGGGTYCSTSHTCTQSTNIFPEGQPCITSCGNTALTYPTGFSGAGIFGTGQIFALGGGSGGSGGVGDGYSTTIPFANTGGGGGGGGGYDPKALVGAHGANGVVFIKYQLPITTSGTTIYVNRNAIAGGTLTSAGTVVLEYSLLTDTNPSCATSYTVYGSISVTNAVDDTFTVVDGDTTTIDSSQLARGYCYRWTQDSSLGSAELSAGAAAPVDSNGNIFGNLTSPVIMLPKRVGLKLPSVIVVDPRTSGVTFPGMTKSLSGAGEPQFCFYEVSTNSSSASPMNTTITFTGSQITGQHLTNIPNGMQFYDVLAQAEKGLSSLTLTSSSRRYFGNTRYVLIKTVPYMPTFNSDCTGANTGDLNTTSNDAYVITIKPLTLTRTVSKDIAVHH
jgi:hypothetical protein